VNRNTEATHVISAMSLALFIVSGGLQGRYKVTMMEKISHMHLGLNAIRAMDGQFNIMLDPVGPLPRPSEAYPKQLWHDND